MALALSPPMRPLRILHVVPAYYPATYWGGPTFSTYGLCNALASRDDIQLSVLTTDTAGPATHERVVVEAYPTRYEPGYDVYFARKWRGRDLAPGLLPEIFRLARWSDIVHLTATYSFPTLPTLAIAYGLGKPLVWSPRGAVQATHEWDAARRRRLKGIWEGVMRRLMPAETLIHATADIERDICARRFPGVDSVVIPNGVDVPTQLRPRTWRPEGRIRLIYLSRLDVKKGLENLIEALGALPVQVSLDIYGTGPEQYVRRLKDRVAAAGLAERVTFNGHVEGEAKTRAFSEADIFVLPSFSENFGIVVAEALAHGVPVVTSRATPWSVVEKCGCGLWVDNAPGALTSAVEQLADADLAAMGARGRWVAEMLGWDSLADRMVTEYRKLSGRIALRVGTAGAPADLEI